MMDERDMALPGAHRRRGADGCTAAGTGPPLMADRLVACRPPRGNGVTPPPLVALRGVSKRYATGTLAVRGVGLEVAEGDFVALLGPSGCGKSTLLRIVAGLAEPTAGAVEWPAAAPGARAASRPERQIGFVFQEPTLMGVGARRSVSRRRWPRPGCVKRRGRRPAWRYGSCG